MIANETEIKNLKEKYLAGNFGYGHAKQALFEKISERFENERSRFNHFMENPDEVEKALAIGAQKASDVANATLERVREVLGY